MDTRTQDRASSSAPATHGLVAVAFADGVGVAGRDHAVVGRFDADGQPLFHEHKVPALMRAPVLRGMWLAAIARRDPALLHTIVPARVRVGLRMVGHWLGFATLVAWLPQAVGQAAVRMAVAPDTPAHDPLVQALAGVFLLAILALIGLFYGLSATGRARRAWHGAEHLVVDGRLLSPRCGVSVVIAANARATAMLIVAGAIFALAGAGAGGWLHAVAGARLVLVIAAVMNATACSNSAVTMDWVARAVQRRLVAQPTPEQVALCRETMTRAHR